MLRLLIGWADFGRARRFGDVRPDARALAPAVAAALLRIVEGDAE